MEVVKNITGISDILVRRRSCPILQCFIRVAHCPKCGAEWCQVRCSDTYMYIYNNVDKAHFFSAPVLLGR